MKKNESPLFSEERRQAILRMIEEQKKVLVTELAASLGVTGATIRSDLRDLEASNLLLRTHGGAIERPRARYEMEMRERAEYQSPAKKAIAQVVYDQVLDGDTILLDTGTTTRELAYLLSDKQRLTVVTNDISIAAALEPAPGVDVFIIGGMLRKGFQCTIGGTLADLTVDKGFFGTNSFSVDAGASTPDISQAAAKREMLRIAKKVFLLCDHEKFGRVSFSRFASLEDIDTLVTDQISGADRRHLEQAGIEILTP